MEKGKRQANQTITRRRPDPALVLYLLLCVFLAGSAGAQKAAAKPKPKKPRTTIPLIAPEPDQTLIAPSAPEPPPDDPLGRSTPYGAVVGFLESVNSNRMPRAVKYLDTSLPEEKAEELALQLKAVLDQGLSSSIIGLSHDPLGDLKDDLPPMRERVGVAKTSNGNLDIFLDRVTRPPDAPIWIFSAETLEQIPHAHANLRGIFDLSQYFPAPLVQGTFLGLPWWRWIVNVLVLAVVLIFSGLVTRLLFFVIKIVLKRKQVQNEHELITRLRPPVRILLIAISITFLAPYTLSVLARSYWTASARTLLLIGFAWLLVRLADIVGNIYERRYLDAGVRQKIAVITLARRLFKICAFFLVFLLLLKGAGINVSAMLAGLGIGGIALALAAQKTLEDLFGGISIILRDSIRVGDYCRVADQTGVIEDIGLSSTRVRTLDRTIVSIPNSKIASFNSENFALRDKFWFHHILTLAADTTIDQVEEILANLWRLMQNDSEVEIGGRVNFIGLSNSSPQIEIFVYLRSSTYELFLIEQQKLLLKVLATIAASEVSLASPTHLILERDPHSTTLPSDQPPKASP